jgi:MYXO-CTERM domain-containing protein
MGSCSVSLDGTQTCDPVTTYKQCTAPYSSIGGGTVAVDDEASGPGTQNAAGAAGRGDVPPTGPSTPGSGTPTGGTRGHHTLPWLNPVGGGIWCQFSAMSPVSNPTGWSALLGLVGLAVLRRRRGAR